MTEAMETMPQTVPSLVFSVYDYSTSFAADFDLSLLPSDGEVPNQQQFLSFYYDTVSPPPMFPSPSGDHKDDSLLKSIKEEFPASVDVGYQSWESSPTHSTFSSPVYCPSASPVPDTLSKIKQEITIDLEEILQESKYLQEICFPEKKKDSIIRNILENNDVKPEKKPEPDHRLLREVLKDTSFQRKYNLKPFDIGGLGTAFKAEVKMETSESEGTQGTNGTGQGSGEGAGPSAAAVCGVDIAQDKIEPMLSLAIEQLKEDLSKTCTVLGIAMDPVQWSAEDVKAWLVYNLQQFNLSMSVVDYFNMTGSMLAQLTEEEFQQRAPQGGSLLHAQLEIWKAACVQGPSVDVHGLLETSTQSSSSCGDASEDEEDDDMADSPQPSSASPKGRGGSHIHLWQFLKELLANPQANGACIRWLDRANGVFKIEDSVRVARLWGKRKNRPAMNYDKLSRSIRQYYKKGIMKKTERSQRLVYQFCHPYSL